VEDSEQASGGLTSGAASEDQLADLVVDEDEQGVREGAEPPVGPAETNGKTKKTRLRGQWPRETRHSLNPRLLRSHVGREPRGDKKAKSNTTQVLRVGGGGGRTKLELFAASVHADARYMEKNHRFYLSEFLKDSRLPFWDRVKRRENPGEIA